MAVPDMQGTRRWTAALWPQSSTSGWQAEVWEPAEGHLHRTYFNLRDQQRHGTTSPFDECEGCHLPGMLTSIACLGPQRSIDCYLGQWSRQSCATVGQQEAIQLAGCAADPKQAYGLSGCWRTAFSACARQHGLHEGRWAGRPLSCHLHQLSVGPGGAGLPQHVCTTETCSLADQLRRSSKLKAVQKQCMSRKRKAISPALKAVIVELAKVELHAI